MCVWNLKSGDRKCCYCSYPGSCEKHPYGEKNNEEAIRWIEAMNTVVGEDVRRISRRKNVLWGRNFLAYKAKVEGLSLSQIGKVIDRDHSTALYAYRMGERAINNPRMYSDVIQTWENFQKQLL